MQKTLAVVFTVLALIATMSGFAEAQLPPPVTPIGGIVPVRSGIKGRVVDLYGQPVPGASVIVSLTRYDPQIGTTFADRNKSIRVKPCTRPGRINCVNFDGGYFIADDQLPQGEYGGGRELDIRAESPNHFHPLPEAVRTWVYPNGASYLGDIFMREIGLILEQPHFWWVDSTTLSVGMWVRSEGGPEEMNFDITFSGSSWTKAEVTYGLLTSPAEVSNEWRWIEKWFGVPPKTTGFFNGALCGEVQIRPTWSDESVLGKAEKVCIALPRPIFQGGGGGGGQ